jgi:hypothetical protein
VVKKLLLISLCLFMFVGCKTTSCYRNYFANVISPILSISIDKRTLKGIGIDSGGYSVDTTKLDGRVDKIVACIQEVGKTIGMASIENATTWQCLRRDFSKMEDIKRSCLVIKIVPPVYSKCSDWQFTGAKAPDAGCISKGLTPTAECPCMWRSAVQNDNILVTPPAMYIWDIGRIFTGCNNIWFSPFAKCLSY